MELYVNDTLIHKYGLLKPEFSGGEHFSTCKICVCLSYRKVGEYWQLINMC